jgi:hypothetical protein
MLHRAKKNQFLAEHIVQYIGLQKTLVFLKSAYSPVSSEVTFVTMSVLLLGILECGIFVIKFKTVGALRFCSVCSALLCSCFALL